MTEPPSPRLVPRLADAATGKPFTIGVGLVVLAMLATWLPHYLTWPWWPDLDAWATIAQGWDRGIWPYRDVAMFNFPGQIEIAYVLGKLGGWGQTWPVYALDAGLLVGFGVMLATWSRIRMGRALPGLLGFAAIVSTYARLDYSLVGQRDWQGPLLALMGLLAIQVGRSWPSLLASAILMGIGLTIRPHVALFGPVLILAILLRSRGQGRSWSRIAVVILIWGATILAVLALTFSPFLISGTFRDFLAGIRQASYASGYNQTTRDSFVRGVLRGLGLDDLGGMAQEVRQLSLRDAIRPRREGWKVLFGIIFLAVSLARSDRPARSTIAPWLAALLLVLLYEPLHPKRHEYLVLPIRLVWGVSLALIAWGMMRATARWPVARLVGLSILLFLAVPNVPRYCSIADTYRAIAGTAEMPGGAIDRFRPRGPWMPGDARSPYSPEDYRRVLDHLRRTTRPTTLVANLLRNVPFPSINGPVGRASPLPGESGIIWIWSVDPEAEGRFIENLERTPPGTVVVWSPEEPCFDSRLRLDHLREFVRKTFRPEAQFGVIEVWRKPAPGG